MSMIKRHLESEIERIAKASGYTFDELMDIYNEIMELEGEVDMLHFEHVSMENDW